MEPLAAEPLAAAVFAAEELEETAKLVVLTRGLPVRHLEAGQIEALHARFKLK